MACSFRAYLCCVHWLNLLPWPVFRFTYLVILLFGHFAIWPFYFTFNVQHLMWYYFRFSIIWWTTGILCLYQMQYIPTFYDGHLQDVYNLFYDGHLLQFVASIINLQIIYVKSFQPCYPVIVYACKWCSNSFN